MTTADERAREKAALTAAWQTFRRELPRLIESGETGRHVLVTADQVVGVWDTFDEALKAGSERFGLDQEFLAQPIDPRLLQFPVDTPIRFPGRLSDAQPEY
jgi:hypothetical protein